LRVGPFGDKRGASKLVRACFAPPVRRGAAVTVPLRWEAAGAAGEPFPVLDADLILARHGEDQTLLALTGPYRPPFGQAGALLDKAIMHRLAAAGRACRRHHLPGTAAPAISRDGRAAASHRGSRALMRRWLPPRTLPALAAGPRTGWPDSGQPRPRNATGAGRLTTVDRWQRRDSRARLLRRCNGSSRSGGLAPVVFALRALADWQASEPLSHDLRCALSADNGV
jgi:hypothetical protein